MRIDPASGKGDPEMTDLDRALRSLPAAPVPPDLLSRCLETIHASAGADRSSWRRYGRWAGRLAPVAAAILLVVGLSTLARPRPAAAAGFLQALGVGWTEVPACHRVVAIKTSALARTIETWYVRGKGGREETRSQDRLIGVVVNNGRWEFRWDVAERLVAAWSPALLGRRGEFERAGLVQNSESLLRWAEAHKADVHVEPDTVGGKAVRKVTLRWPGPEGAGAKPQIDTLWFDPETLRPLKRRSELWDGGTSEAIYDYPAPEHVPADLFQFQPPADATLEINDPELGRQVYSEPRAGERDLIDSSSKGAK